MSSSLLKKMSNSELCLSPEAEFSLDDCDALLKFPYQDYVHKVKEEVKDPDLPELGTSAHLIIDGNDTFTDGFDDTFSEQEGPSNDPKELKACLAKNNTLQQKIIQSMAKLVDALGKNKLKQEEIIQKLKTEEKCKNLGEGKCRVVKPISLFAAPYFRDAKGMNPLDNEDTIAKVKNNDVTAYHHPPRPWTLAEKDKLVEGVGANALSYILRPYKAKRDYLKSKMKDKNVTDDDIRNLKKEIIYIERKMRMECERTYKDLVAEAKDNIDWLTISCTNLEGHRNEEECELLWNNYLSPFVSKGPFTDEEDANLKMLVENYKARNWVAITEELNTNRSVIQVFERYQTNLNKKLFNRFWTPEEDKKLKSLVETYKMGKFIPWTKICCKMEGWSRYQIINRYERCVDEDIRREPLSHEEDAMLYACVSKFRNKWTKMQEFFSGRPVYTLRERYVNGLDPALRMGNWSKAEDIELIKLIKKHGYGRWSVISRHLSGRTDNMCFCRTKRLIIHSLAKAKKEDINWDCENVHKLVDMLKPVASSKICVRQNSRLRNTQNKAREVLKSAFEKIAPLIDETVDLETFDLSTVSINTLRLLCKELRTSETKTETVKWTPKYFPLPGVTRPVCGTGITRRKRLRRDSDTQSFNESVEESLSDETNDEGELHCSEVEKIWLKRVLENKFQDEASVLNNSNCSKNKKIVCLSRKETLECSVYQTFLQKELLCKNYLDDEDFDTVCGTVDYNCTLAKVTHYFIQPPIAPNELIVLAPNFSTLHGLDMILTTKNRLRRTANFVDHSMPYIRYVTGFSDDPPKCIACCVESGAPPPESTYKQVVKDMKSSMLVVDEVMNKEALLETRSCEIQQQQCRCSVLEKSKADIDLLTKRFVSMFMWPYLLASTGVNEAQEGLVYKPNPVKYGSEDSRKLYGGPKPKISSPKKKARIKKENALCSANNARKKRAYVKKKPPMKQEIKSESKSKVSTSTPLRRSARACVRNRKSFTDAEVHEQELT